MPGELLHSEGTLRTRPVASAAGMEREGHAGPAPAAGRAILLTPTGAAAIAVVRLLGPGVGAFLRSHFSHEARPGRCVHGELRDHRGVIDDPVVVLSDAGDVADLNLHGGAWVVRSTLDLADRAGFEVAAGAVVPLPAEAVDAGDELEREVLTHLPLAKTDLAVRSLLAQPAAWAEARTALGLAPGNEPAPAPAPAADAAGRIASILADESLYRLLHPPRVAIVGAPNVGKSTLANQLFGQERSITADLAGTTRDWVGETANVDGLAVTLVDTPGVRQTADPVEHAAIRRAGEEIAVADLIILVLDATRPLDPEQRPLLDAYPDAVCVINKSDRAGSREPISFPGIPTVATTGRGVDDLRAAILDRFGCRGVTVDRPRWWTRRQRDVIVRAVHDAGALRAL